MIKKVSGNKVRKEQMDKLMGGEAVPIIAAFANACDCYCWNHCGDKCGSNSNQQGGQYEYRE